MDRGADESGIAQADGDGENERLIMEKTTTRAYYWSSNPEGKNQFPDCRMSPKVWN